jgi:rare lipoprotein A
MAISKWRVTIRRVLALTALLLPTSCTTQQEPPQPSSVPYVVAPPPAPAPSQSRANPSNAVRASYQGDAYAGHRTANGERYDPNALTAASKTLPLGSSVIVTNPSTGRSVTVRINDRGPNVRGRSLDLSKRAAEELGMTNKGVSRVTVKRADSKPARGEVPKSVERSSPATPPDS